MFTIYIAIVLFILTLFFPLSHVQAYIDPGTGSYFIQIVLASVFATSLLFKDVYIKAKDKLVNILFSKKRRGEKKDKQRD